jgi:hypothetical protein
MQIAGESRFVPLLFRGSMDGGSGREPFVQNVHGSFTMSAELTVLDNRGIIPAISASMGKSRSARRAANPGTV